VQENHLGRVAALGIPKKLTSISMSVIGKGR